MKQNKSNFIIDNIDNKNKCTNTAYKINIWRISFVDELDALNTTSIRCVELSLLDDFYDSFV